MLISSRLNLLIKAILHLLRFHLVSTPLVPLSLVFDITVNVHKALAAEFISIDWNEVFTSESDATNVNSLFQSFYSRTTEIIDKHVPVRKLTRKEIKSLSKPWITFGVRTSIRVKQKLYEKYLKSGNTYYLTKYRYYRNKVSGLIKNSKRE